MDLNQLLYCKKSMRGKIELIIPRDRESEFERVIIRKHQRRFGGFDDAILSLYSRGMSTRDIKARLEEIYGIEVSPGPYLFGNRSRYRRS